MKKVKTDRYQKQRSPEPESIDFSGPAIGARPPEKVTPTPEKKDREDQPNELASEPSNGRTEERTDEQSSEQMADGLDNRSSESPVTEHEPRSSYLISVPEERVEVRHSFDVFEDQKLALDRLQMAIRDNGGPKPNLGDMVQQALDAYIKRQTNELPNVQMWTGRTNVRMEETPVSEPTRIDKVLPATVEDLKRIFEVKRERCQFSPVIGPLVRMTLHAKLLSADDEQNAFATTVSVR